MMNTLLKNAARSALLSAGLLLGATALTAQQTPTADQGKNDGADRNTMRQIRRDVVRDKSLSTYAHNVKIIAENGTVTLTGPVRTDTEKKTILAYAQKHAGQGHVVDQMTVDSK